MGDRRRRQSAEKQRKQAKAYLGRVIGEENRKINDAERNEARAEKHLDRMRMATRKVQSSTTTCIRPWRPSPLALSS